MRSKYARLLAPQRHALRLVLLNACEGARSGQVDLFASTAATLVGSGLPAVLAMQYTITDEAAVQCARTFYEALADNLPVDSAVADARNAMTLRNRFSLEWGTPVLYLRAPDGRLFDLATTVPTTPVKPPAAVPVDPPTTAPVEARVSPAAAEQPSIITFLRTTLTHLYPNESDARRVVADAGLAADRITFSGHATNTWHAILTEAEKTGQIGVVLAVALKEYGSNQTLQVVAAMHRGGVSSAASTGSAATTGSSAATGAAGVTSALAEPAEANALVTRTASPIDFDWVTIPAGKFWMGSDKAKDNLAFDWELPQHEVHLPTFHIARYPVTNSEYKRFIDAKGYQPPSHWQKGQIPLGKENHPVVEVSWQDAMAFCDWAGVQLPSEAQWEKAARGSSTSAETAHIYPWGNEAPDNERCNFGGEVDDTTPVDHYSKGKSFYGVFDMVGNVWEWTSSRWGQNWEEPDFGYPYDPQDGREDPAATGLRVLRGGSFDYDDCDVRCAARHSYDPDYEHERVGFRVVVSPGS